MSYQELDPNVILAREFDYAAQTAFQANEDRVRLFHYYLATAGTMIAASVLADLTNRVYLAVFSLAISGLALLGFILLLKLARLRIAWTESVHVMCRIKQYYIERCMDIQLREAFKWKKGTIPDVSSKWTVAFLMAMVIGFFSSTATGGAVLFWGLIAEDFWV
jgi:hypothetical protein